MTEYVAMADLQKRASTAILETEMSCTSSHGEPNKLSLQEQNLILQMRSQQIKGNILLYLLTISPTSTWKNSD